MIGSACRSGRTSPAFKKPRGHLLSQSVCVKIQANLTSAPESIITPDSTMIRKERATEPHFGHGFRSFSFTLGDSSMTIPQLAQEVIPAMPG